MLYCSTRIRRAGMQRVQRELNWMTIMSSHKPQTICEMPSFLIHSSAEKSGIWRSDPKWYWVCWEGWRRRERGCEGSLCVPICVFVRRVWVRDKLSEKEVKKETTVISSVYSFMPSSSLWGIHWDVWLQIWQSCEGETFWTAACVWLCV